MVAIWNEGARLIGIYVSGGMVVDIGHIIQSGSLENELGLPKNESKSSPMDRPVQSELEPVWRLASSSDKPVQRPIWAVQACKYASRLTLPLLIRGRHARFRTI